MNENINSRIAYLVRTIGGDSPKRFGEIIGITPQYVAKIAKEGGSVGIEPVTRILKALPDLNARWLILGEGDPFDRRDKEAVLKQTIDRGLKALADLERYIPAMSAEELDNLSRDLFTGTIPDIDPDRLAGWEKSINEQETRKREFIREQIKKSVCPTR